MKFFHYDKEGMLVHILPDRDDRQGLFLGELSDEDFAKMRTTFVVQALFHHKKIDVTGLNIQIVNGPSLAH